jgi:hypothetical protein
MYSTKCSWEKTLYNLTSASCKLQVILDDTDPNKFRLEDLLNVPNTKFSEISFDSMLKHINGRTDTSPSIR